MWQRLSRVVRSFVGFFISVAEDPELILQQNIRDMNDQVPRMNESIAMVKANVTLLEKEEAKYKNDVAGLTAKVKVAIQANRDDLAGSFAAQLEQTKGALARNQGQLANARAAFEKAMTVKQAFMQEKERKTQEALGAIADYRRAQWQKKVADAMEQFEVAGISQTHDEMVRKIEEMTAVNEARMDMAMSNVDQQKFKIEDEAQKLQAAELVKQINATLAGWVNYFRVGNSSRAFSEVRDYVEMKIRTLLTRRKRRRKSSVGWRRWSNEYLYDVLGLYWDWEGVPAVVEGR